METGVNSVELSNSMVGVGRHGLSGRGRNTEAKNLLKASALAVEVVVPGDHKNICGPRGILNGFAMLSTTLN
jgi:hypothetical protein